jgi:hypothetical protein
MRSMVCVLCLFAFTLPLLAQDEAPAGGVFKSDRYPVQVKVPKGWTKEIDKPTPARNWVDVVRFSEPKSKARVSLSVQATNYTGSGQMIKGISAKFQGDASLAILRREVQEEGRRRPKGVLFEYTMRGKSGPEHSIAAYWLHRGKRYRIYGTVREAGWKTASTDIEAFAASLSFTSRAFAKASQNFTDEASNFAMYFPEDWTIKMPTRGPRIDFTSRRLGATVRVYVTNSRGDLKKNMDGVIAKHTGDGGTTITRRKGPENHPDLGYEIMSIEYTKNQGGKEYRYLEIGTVHGDKFYLFLLGVGAKGFEAAKEPFDRMFGSLNFLR